jgi:hypothetical protein
MTTLPEIQQAAWQFPPNQEGAEYGFGDAASAHFRADPMAHLVRETIQNAMDAKLDGLAEPVHVAFNERDHNAAMNLRNWPGSSFPVPGRGDRVSRAMPAVASEASRNLLGSAVLD